MFKAGYGYVICARFFDGSIADVYYANEATAINAWKENMPTSDEMYDKAIHAYFLGVDRTRRGNFANWRVI